MRSRKIEPKAVPPLQVYSEGLASEYEKADAKLSTGSARYPVSGCAVWILFWTIFLSAWGNMRVQGGPFLGFIILTIVLAILVPMLIRTAIRSSKQETIVTNRLRAEHEAALADETRATSVAIAKVETIFREQDSNFRDMNNLVRSANDALKRAGQLFKERAYTPFWDSIEDAVEFLRQFDKRVDYINYQAKEYYSNLAGREHTFPAFPLNGKDLPRPDALLKSLGELIGVAQRDFQFAQIFEQRRTTSAIVTGFRNTQEAISSLRNDLVNSLSDLQRSLDDGLADISSGMRDGFADMAERHERSASDLRETLDRNAQEASEHGAKHQEFVEGALDNIQNKRKPRLSETKEPFRPN